MELRTFASPVVRRQAGNAEGNRFPGGLCSSHLRGRLKSAGCSRSPLKAECVRAHEGGSDRRGMGETRQVTSWAGSGFSQKIDEGHERF